MSLKNCEYLLEKHCKIPAIDPDQQKKDFDDLKKKADARSKREKGSSSKYKNPYRLKSFKESHHHKWALIFADQIGKGQLMFSEFARMHKEVEQDSFFHYFQKYFSEDYKNYKQHRTTKKKKS